MVLGETVEDRLPYPTVQASSMEQQQRLAGTQAIEGDHRAVGARGHHSRTKPPPRIRIMRGHEDRLRVRLGERVQLMQRL